jgi:hypothetical protein
LSQVDLFHFAESLNCIHPFQSSRRQAQFPLHQAGEERPGSAASSASGKQKKMPGGKRLGGCLKFWEVFFGKSKYVVYGISDKYAYIYIYMYFREIRDEELKLGRYRSLIHGKIL